MKSPVRRHFWVFAFALTAVAAAPVAAQPARPKVPDPVEVTLPTKDGVQLRATYYASSAGQQAVPVVMLHDFNETRAVFDPLARRLQNPPVSENPAAPRVASRAVLTVDLRGHGGSKIAQSTSGAAQELESNRFQQQDFRAMVDLDMEAVRAFLVRENDAGKLNLNALGIVGSGMGANVAVIWAAKDWSAPPLPVRKQGQDVKALVLLSPHWNFNGLLLRDALKFPPIQRQLSVLIAYGAEDKAIAKDCQNMINIFSKYHPEPAADRVEQLKDFFVYAPETKLQGTKLLTSDAFGIGPKIVSFLETRLGSQPFPYSIRKHP
ncbi:alpha/beta hydrolase [Lacipirellula sp.]|uniref:alpha/beta hydrolase n=1 Tax=Lacipirellula sp. TaxID=2691419 RepID=UPI003D097170